MLELFGLIYFLVFLSLWFLSGYKESRNKLWKQVAYVYGLNSRIKCKPDVVSGLVFEKEEDLLTRQGRWKNWFNAMNFNLTEKGLFIWPPFTRYLVKRVLIPWADLEMTGPCSKGWLDSYVKLSVNKGSFYFAVSKRLVEHPNWDLLAVKPNHNQSIGSESLIHKRV